MTLYVKNNLYTYVIEHRRVIFGDLDICANCTGIVISL